MDAQSFQQLFMKLEGLTAEQRQAVLTRVQTLGHHDDALRLMTERLGTQVACPHCESASVVRFGHLNGLQRYRCKACGRTFSPLTGTPFVRLHDKSKLMAYAECMAEGLSIRKAAERVGLTVDHAFRWRHRFLAFLREQKPSAMTGVVEADETEFRRSYKGQRKGLPRPPKMRGGPPKEPSDEERVKVLVAMQRGSRLTHDALLDNVTGKALTEALRPVLGQDAVLSSDGHPSYGVAARNLGIEAGDFVASFHGHGGKGIWHVQNVNAYDSRLKNWMFRFHGVATKYLPNYLGWRRLLDRFKDSVTPQQFLFHALRSEFINM